MRHLLITRTRSKLSRHDHGVGSIAFGLKPRLARCKLGQALRNDGEVGACDGIVKTYDDGQRFTPPGASEPIPFQRPGAVPGNIMKPIQKFGFLENWKNFMKSLKCPPK